MADDLTSMLAATVRQARTERGLTVSGFSELSGVSRAMISKIEHGEVQPTAALLAKLSASLGMTLSELIARAEHSEPRLARASEQPVWTDPDSGYRRRAISPPTSGPLELVEVTLPAGGHVDMAAGTYAFISQQIWVLGGHLRFQEGDTTHELYTGDCLQLGPPAPCVFINPTEETCRYLVAVSKRNA